MGLWAQLRTNESVEEDPDQSQNRRYEVFGLHHGRGWLDSTIGALLRARRLSPFDGCRIRSVAVVRNPFGLGLGMFVGPAGSRNLEASLLMTGRPKHVERGCLVYDVK